MQHEQKIDINITLHSSVPKYIQVAECITDEINLGKLKIGQKMPSITELSQKSALSRDTIEKAYKHLRARNLIYSVIGLGYFINGNESVDVLNIFLLINKPSSYKMEICNAFVDAIGSKGNVSVSLYYCDENLFVDTLKKNLGLFDYYVIMPHFANEKGYNLIKHKDKAVDALENMPKDKLILLDTVKEGIDADYNAVYQDFKNDIFNALEQAMDKLKKYQKIILVHPNTGVFPYPQHIMTGFKSFCVTYNFDFEIINHINKNIELDQKYAYITIQESDLVVLMQQLKAKNLKLGKDIGIISYNETPLKSLLDITVISTDFRAMGALAADLILSEKKGSIKNKFLYIERSSL
ncbi:GntR family transcriptional regulator [Flavobacterium reichenbachii]|uniref:Transcriptional regulator n=1 Tax=Flavobacterium reichenbachii TaxID=362418 RepID=A0A085ZE18_9FLAO|nr:GntR family transcriptional regulator [Flavobacterium reichenbachii]KFF02682.1 transcriptional regulator [Flavobacterium reichenbachii]OXB10714.1 transcriptional regulator [Flavobacterium reichenbachii]